MTPGADFLIYITLGRGRIVGIGINEHLVFQDQHGEIDLGLATEARFDELIGYLHQLRVHAVKVITPITTTEGSA